MSVVSPGLCFRAVPLCLAVRGWRGSLSVRSAPDERIKGGMAGHARRINAVLLGTSRNHGAQMSSARLFISDVRVASLVPFACSHFLVRYLAEARLLASWFNGMSFFSVFLGLACCFASEGLPFSCVLV